jgi:hypothetical protein
MNPTLMEMVAQARVTEMRQAGSARCGRAWEGAGGMPAEGRARAVPARPAARRAIGWFLVRLGLRLALSRPFAASAR